MRQSRMFGVMIGLVLLVGSTRATADNNAELKQNVKWCIFHEGCNVYAGDVVRPVSELRNCYIAKEQHNGHAQDVITQANDAVLAAVALEAANEIPGEFNLRENFHWVAYHEGQMKYFRSANAAKNFGGIRGIYHDKQNHNPNARNLLSAVSDHYISDLINSM